MPDANGVPLLQLAREAADLHARGDLARAERLYESILRADPAYADALHLLGVLRAQQGRHEEAVELIAGAIRRNPAFAPAHNSLGNALQALGRTEAARASLEQALALRPDFVEAHYNLGGVLGQLGRTEDAVKSYRRAIALKPDNAQAHFRLGTLLHALSRHEEALSSYRRAAALQAGHAAALHGAALALCATGRHDEAVSVFREVLRLVPDHVEAANNLGAALRILKRGEEAVAACRDALALKPDLAEAHTNLGNALGDLDRPEEAIESYRRALALRPDDADALNNLGLALRGVNRLDEAIDCFDRALAAHPDHAESHFGRAIALLGAGDFAGGWAEYEWRWRAGIARARPEFQGPPWKGEPLAGRTIVLHAEQGYGDTLQFARYAPLVARAGGRVVLQVPGSLKALLTGLPGIAVAGQGEPLPPFDFHCPLMSLPLAFGTRLDSIPAEIPYLRAPAPRLAKWGDVLGPKTGCRIGLVWSGRPDHQNDRNRSIGFERLLPLLEAGGCAFYSLQKDASAADRAAMERASSRFIDLRGQLADFAETAAAISLMDLVISVDTSVAHLTGALGVRLWLLLPYAPDWRWLRDRADSPWYPSARLFRQSAPGGWEAVIKAVLRALGEITGPKGIPEQDGEGRVG